MGQAPPVPLFTLPDLGLLTADHSALTPDQTAHVDSVPGVTVSPARCDQSGSIYLGSTSTVLTGDGSVASSDGDSSVVNNGDGSGSSSNGKATVVNNGNGSGSYTDELTRARLVFVRRWTHWSVGVCVRTSERCRPRPRARADPRCAMRERC